MLGDKTFSLPQDIPIQHRKVCHGVVGLSSSDIYIYIYIYMCVCVCVCAWKCITVQILIGSKQLPSIIEAIVVQLVFIYTFTEEFQICNVTTAR